MINNSKHKNLEKVLKTRSAIADRLNDIVETIEAAEITGQNKSGKLELEAAIADLIKSSDNLRDGVFRLLVLGDVKRGKSTVINALIGEDLLPRDVNSCTAILTVLRYGVNKKVTVYFNDRTTPEELDLDTFKQQYCISPDEAKQFEDEGKLAFSHVKQAVVEYPLPLLKLGVEIVDGPGLNDTVARNQLSLDYIYNCNAILFVLRAIQPFTLAERRYLNNYIKDRSLAVFFLINGWDEIDQSLLDPEDQDALAVAKEKTREYFRNILTEYLKTSELDSDLELDIYNQRVFEISALNALRSSLDDSIINSAINIEQTSFSQFTNALNNFLREDRFTTEFRQAEIIARQAYNRLYEVIFRRIPLLEKSKAELQQKIDLIAPEFDQLEELQFELQQEVQQQGKIQAKSIATSFEQYVLGLEDTFIIDFQQYQPQLDTWYFLSTSKREEFNRGFKQAFERYITDKLAHWSQKVEADLEQAFQELSTSLESYSQSYQEITDTINIKLIGHKIIYFAREQTSDYPKDTLCDRELDWKNWTIGCLALASGNLGGIALASAGLSWRQVLINWLSVIGISRFIPIFTGAFLNPYSVLFVGLGLASVQTSFAHQEFIKLTKQEFGKYLPKIAQEQKTAIQEIVANCFENYEQQLVKKINNDIKARKAELANLVQQQEMSDRDRNLEIQRLQTLDDTVLADYQEIESLVSFG